MKRRELRQKALQALYQMDVGKTDVTEAIGHVFEESPEATNNDVAYVRQLVRGTWDSQQEIDNQLSETVQGWSLDRIARVEHNVLRMAMYELLHEFDVDIATIVDEAVELAKAFSTEESGRFVNGVLAKMLPAVQRARQLGPDSK